MSGVCVPPSMRYGELFTEVQLRRIFSDSKTFADAVPRREVALILAEFDGRRRTDGELLSFVLDNFLMPAQVEVPPALTWAESMEDHIGALWPKLTRSHDGPAFDGSEIRLPAAFVVPGGRFRENYYWDGYYTMLGLLADGRADLAEATVDNLTYLVERHGLIPNGSRSYYLTRSQPPHYAMMVDRLAPASPAVAERRLAAMRQEHAFWMAGAARAISDGACERVVRLPDGALLNRYWDDSAEPRDEALSEDIETAAASGRDPAEVYRHLRAGAESGWDYSSRWLADGDHLASIRTTDIVPVDLNALLYTTELIIAQHSDRLGRLEDGVRYRRLALARKAAVRRWLWNEEEQRFADFDWTTGRSTSSVNAAFVHALAAGLATAGQARASAALLKVQLLAVGGVRATTKETNQQWDAPNGWAPLQWTAVMGLRRYRHKRLAREVASRWLRTVAREYHRSGRLLEKYDVEHQRPGGGGEYPLQDGFGWTNGVVKALLAFYPDLRAELASPASGGTRKRLRKLVAKPLPASLLPTVAIVEPRSRRVPTTT